VVQLSEPAEGYRVSRNSSLLMKYWLWSATVEGPKIGIVFSSIKQEQTDRLASRCTGFGNLSQAKGLGHSSRFQPRDELAPETKFQRIEIKTGI